MQGPLTQLQKEGVPAEIVEAMKDALDCNLYFFGKQVTTAGMYLILGGTVTVLIAAYVLLHTLNSRRPK
jgi:multidrug/hemolysin transport system permease protein